MKKTIFSLVLSLIFVFSAISFSACGKKEDDKGSGGNTYGEGIVYDAKKGEMYKDTKEGKQVIKINFSNGWGDEWLKVIAGKFLMEDEYSNYYFDLDADPSATSSLSGRLESGKYFCDISMVLASNWQSYASLGQLENLNGLYETKVPGEEVTVGEKMTGTWKEYGKSVYKGKEDFYALPWNENVTGIVYNADMFEQYGWEVPVTVGDLYALCEQIVKDTKGKVAPFVYPGSIGGYFSFLGMNWWLQASGVDGLNEFFRFESPEVYNPDKEPSLGKLKMLYAFDEIFVQNARKFTLKGSASKNHLAAQISFGAGQAAMIPNGNWLENESGKDISFNMKMMRVPYLEDAKKDENGEYIKISYAGTPDYIVIPASANNKQGAKDFLAYMCKDEILKLYTQKTGTPRPFTYDVRGGEYSDFVSSCLEIWETSYNWFDNSTSPLYRANKTKPFVTTNPFTELLYNETATPDSWCASEYKAVSAIWDEWVNAVK